jgi:hypothetical protein
MSMAQSLSKVYTVIGTKDENLSRNLAAATV